MDCANASVYDGGTALFEACMMAVRATRRKKLVVDQCINPIWRAMLETYSSSLDITLVTVPHKDGLSDMEGLKAAVDATCAAVLVQNPNFFGAIDDFTELFSKAKEHKALGIISVYPVMQSVLKTPGEMGADIAVAEGQSLGMPLAFGGPYLGIIACKKDYIRQMPGRIVGKTKDLNGKEGFVLTLQAREQHIRRAKATSNICSNQGLCALRSIIHMALLGPEGLKRTLETHCDEVSLLAFPDHHAFGKKDLLKVEKAFKQMTGDKRMIVTTEKDAARLIAHDELDGDIKPFIYTLPIEVKFLNNEESTFNQKIIEYVRKNPRNSSIHQS